MISDQEQFKLDRFKVIMSGDILLLRAWADKYSVKLPADDLKAMAALQEMPIWD